MRLDRKILIDDRYEETRRRRIPRTMLLSALSHASIPSITKVIELDVSAIPRKTGSRSSASPELHLKRSFSPLSIDLDSVSADKHCRIKHPKMVRDLSDSALSYSQKKKVT